MGPSTVNEFRAALRSAREARGYAKAFEEVPVALEENPRCRRRAARLWRFHLGHQRVIARGLLAELSGAYGRIRVPGISAEARGGAR